MIPSPLKRSACLLAVYYWRDGRLSAGSSASSKVPVPIDTCVFSPAHAHGSTNKKVSEKEHNFYTALKTVQ